MRLPRNFRTPLPSAPREQQRRSVLLLRRQQDANNPPMPPPGKGETSNKALIIAVVFVAVVVFVFLAYIILRFCRKRRQEPPKFFPEPLKKRWRNWTPGTYTSPGPTARLPSTRHSARRNRREQREVATAAGVDRNTSVRSVMTLPEYRPVAAADRERTIAREGERGGIDVVIEFPETQDEEEGRREEHMQTLYEIRLARQLERATTRESAELSAAAAAGRPGSSGSSVRLVTPDPPMSASQLMTALASITERERRLSKVQYAEIGVARHDGTRVRPSMDSDRPLLDASASMGNSGNSVRSGHGRSGSGNSEFSALGTPEHRGSEEIIRMGSARPSTDTRREQSNDNESPTAPITAAAAPAATAAAAAEDDRPPPPSFDDTIQAAASGDYDGSEWGPPPDYTSPLETRNYDINSLPILRIDTGTPSPDSRTTTPQPRQSQDGSGGGGDSGATRE